MRHLEVKKIAIKMKFIGQVLHTQHDSSITLEHISAKMKKTFSICSFYKSTIIEVRY